jgi:LCP family protein required for cell wall assembly
VLLGSDREDNDSSWWRTDVIVLVSVNPAGPYVSLLSIPRDLYVWIPGYGFDRINTADYRGAVNRLPGGGPGTVKATIEYNLGIPVHYYARVDFASFVSIVDTLGGVDVPVECELHDTFPNPENPEEGIDLDLMPGVQHLNGLQSLWYIRSRWSTHDFDRNRRQQQVLRALYSQSMNLDLVPHIPELWETVREHVETDLELADLVQLGLIAAQLDWANVKSRFISSAYLEYWVAPSGAHVLLPLTDGLVPVVTEALQPPAAGRADQPAFTVEVWNGSGRPELGAVAVQRLGWEGFVVTGLLDVGPYARTQIVDLTTSYKGSPLSLLMRLYRRNYDDIISQPTEGSPVDLRVILGADYDPCVSTALIQYVAPPTPTPTPPPTPGP